MGSGNAGRWSFQTRRKCLQVWCTYFIKWEQQYGCMPSWIMSVGWLKEWTQRFAFMNKGILASWQNLPSSFSFLYPMERVLNQVLSQFVALLHIANRVNQIRGAAQMWKCHTLYILGQNFHYNSRKLIQSQFAPIRHNSVNHNDKFPIKTSEWIVTYTHLCPLPLVFGRTSWLLTVKLCHFFA